MNNTLIKQGDPCENAAISAEAPHAKAAAEREQNRTI